MSDSLKIPLITPLVFMVSLILASTLGNLFQPSVNCYRLKKRPTKF